jgi:DnaJ-class molecular chaperone
MANYEIKIKTLSAAASKGPKPANYSSWPCPFCHGTGLNPHGQTGGERCPACRGQKAWEVEANSSFLTNCGRCAGSGRINYMGNWAPCTSCKGSGKV